MPNYKEIALASRKKVLELVYKAGTSHIGSLMGCADIYAVLFENFDFDKDKFVAGKSWSAALLYYHLWRKGRITQEELNSYCQPGSKFIGLIEPVTKDIPFGIGSMGYGLSAGVGFALSKKLKKEPGIVYVLETDGSMNVGINWEAIMFAAHWKLDNLVLIIEKNGFQAMGKTKDILNYLPMANGWVSLDVDGHDYEQIEKSLSPGLSLEMPQEVRGIPRMVWATTTKGKGVSFMSGQNLWHYAKVKDEDYQNALAELNA